MRSLLMLAVGAIAVCQEPPQFRTDIQLVMVDVQVVEKGIGKVLEFLTEEDFVISDNSQARPVREFQFETTPLDIVFVLCGQMWAPPKEVNDFRKGLTEAAAQLRARDRSAVIRGDSKSKIALAMTNDHDATRRTLLEVDRGVSPNIGFSGRGKLYDAVKTAATIFPRPKESGRRRAIVAVTTDIERGSRTQLEPLITDLLEADATLNAIVVAGNPGGIRLGGGTIPGGPRVATTIQTIPTAGESIRAAIEATGGEAVPGDQFREQFPRLIDCD